MNERSTRDAAGASDGDRKGDGYRHTKGAGMKEVTVYRVRVAEVHRASPSHISRVDR